MQIGISKKWLFLPLSILIIFTLLSAGCSTTKNTTAVTPAAGTSKPHIPARTGDIKTGAKVDAVSQSINTAGGMISVSKPGDPLDGFVIDVPTNSYTGNNTFNVSYAPITSQTFGSDITPISPMISVDNGGAFSNEMMYIRVPVKIPDGYFAMGFYYDATTKQLEGMSLLSTDADSITVGAMHFSNFFISMISKTLLKSDIDSDFRPGVDDWQFPNVGSYIAPGGHCEGQSLTALWYYFTQPDGANARLYGRYDNNGDKPATPALWEDDSLGYRFASVVQKDIKPLDSANSLWLNAAGKDIQQDESGKWKLVDIPGISNEATWDLFAYSIQATHEPQEVGLYNQAGDGHAMICYRIFEGNLYIADPNYQGNLDRRIIYSNGTFQPYNSGKNADEIAKGNGTAFETIQYVAKSTVLPWDKIAQRWTEFKKKTIGNDKFPGYQLSYKDDKGNWVPLTDGLKTSFDAIAIAVGSNFAIGVYRDGERLRPDAKGNYDLQPGNNKLGIFIGGKVDDVFEYVDFKYINVVYGDLTIDPPTMNGVPDEPYTFTAKMDNLPAKARLDWLVDGVQKKSGTDLSLTISFPNEGTHTISAKVVDSTGGIVMQAQATAVIKTLPTTATVANNLKALQQMKQFNGFLQGGYKVKEGTEPVPFDVYMPLSWGTPPSKINIIWNGASFSGTLTTPGSGVGTVTNTVSGTVSDDGNTLSFVFTFRWDTSNTNGDKVNTGEWTHTLQIENLPFEKDISGNFSQFHVGKYGSALKPYLVKYEEHSISYTNGKLISEKTYFLDNIAWNGTGTRGEPNFHIYFNK
jgi:hypothetical protein